MFELYIYYQVADVHAAELLPLVRSMQAALARHEDVGTGLKRRPESEHGLQTWMEIYTGTAPDFADRLALAVGAAGIAHLIDGRRHTEVFTELPPCA
ncbi:DUF4936 family protein [Massilia sp. S19_KUP03_FR1]|uniref:DUF4936 family protein n=1 Tax=Massilia sp. S19_KUP03_FR1 TaxID=3025503 RepID=UPI002FCD98F8